MVLKKKLDYGFIGYQIPVVPRAPRSVRRRCSTKKMAGDHKICAFELLAAVAGKFLQENESSSTSSNAYGAKDLNVIHKEYVKEERSCVESVFIPELVAKPIVDDTLIIPNLTSSDSSKNVDCELKLGVCNLHTKVGDSLPSKDPVIQFEDIINHSKDLTAANTYSVKKQVEKSMYSEPQLINSDNNNSVQLSLFKDQLPNASFLRHRNDLHLGIRDDENNSFRCNKFRAYRQQSRNYYGRIIREKRWKSMPKLRDYYAVSNTNDGMRSVYRNKRRIHTENRFQQEVPFKKRMVFDRSFEVNNDGIRGAKFTSVGLLNGGNAVSTSFKDHRKKKDSKVKFSIKSFRVPELYIEVPETETIGSLKRTVMETVTAILGNGLRIGLVVQGERIGDDNRTLQQAGIYNNNLDTLGFILEPNCNNKVTEISKDSSHLNIMEQRKSLGPPENINNDTIASYGPHDDGALTDEPKALVPEPLTVVPMNRKNKRTEFSQRRTRRPFSVSEVEALVEAVEVLGAGRWRDVKMRAFENADHRTYVDLKDKWKTLVHTASISSQQRRGEPVPQGLLDRVLSAHSYWSQCLSKPHHGKHHHHHRAEPINAIEARRVEPLEV